MKRAKSLAGDEGVAVKLDRQGRGRVHRGYWLLRRGQDILLSLLALAVLAPALLLLVLIIYIDDPHGSPIYSQIRCGKNGKAFRMYKFRTMCIDAGAKLAELLDQNEMDGPVFKIRDDPRITRIGRFLRRTGIDELPQLVNVLKGDMSIVGPRPALPREVAEYNSYQRQRLSVTPGLTCYWQIQPHRNELSFDKWVELDVRYIRERSFWVDWKIIFMTIGAVVHGYGE